MGKRLTDEQKLEAANKYLDGTPAAIVGAEYGTHRSTVIRWSKQIEHFQETKAPTNIYKEFGVTGLNRFGGHIQEDYLQPWKTLDTMVPLIKEMIDYPAIGAILFATKMVMRGADWTAVPASDSDADKKAAEFLEECWNDMSHTPDDHISQALTMIPYGFAPFEIIYKKRLGPDDKVPSKYDDGKIGWRKFALRSQDSLYYGDEWIFDDAGGIRGMNQTDKETWKAIPIPIEKLILYRTTAEKNNPQGISALRSTYMSYFYAKNMQEIEGIAAEKLGTGVPVMYLGKGTTLSGTNSDFEFAKSVVRDSRADQQMGIVLPFPKMITSGDRAGQGVLFELVSPPSKGLVDFNQVIERYNQQISQTLLAQFIFFGLTERGTQALAVRTTDFFTSAVEGWLGSMADTINRHIIPRLFRLNAGAFGGITGYPEFEIGPIGEIDVKLFAEALEKLVGANLLIPHEGDERTVRQILELPDIDDPELGDELEAPQWKQDQQNAMGGAFGGGSPGVGPDIKPPDKKSAIGMEKEELMSKEETEEMVREIENLERLMKLAEDALDELKAMKYQQMAGKEDSRGNAPDVHVHVPKAPDVHLHPEFHVDAPKTIPDVNVNVEQPDIHVDGPQIDVHVPEHKAPDVHVNVEASKAAIPPQTVIKMEPKFDIKAELHSPDEILETETTIDRDTEGFIRRTLRKTLKRRK